MMKAAEATSAMQSTLRPGRVVALRIPIRATGHAPCPRIVRFLSERSHADQKKRMAMSSNVPAPKKPPTCPITFDATATNNATPSAPKMKLRDMRKKIEDRGSKIEDRLARNDATLDPRSSILDPRSSTDPDNRLRGDAPLNDLSVHQTQTSAVTIPDNAPISKDCDVTRSSSSVVPTAPTHHVRNPNIISAP